ncbi:MAG: hypothetical protein AAGF84_06305 [Planctomycetota bacterium]
MKWLVLAIVVLSPAILYGVALLILPFWRSRCPLCRKRSLKMVGCYKWDGPDGGGLVSFYFCEQCHARLKDDRGFSEVADEEWNRHARWI